MENEIIKPGYDRVTSIVGQWNDFSRFKEAVEAKAIIGTEVHKIIEMNEKGLFFGGSFRAENYFKAYLSWKRQQGHSPERMEERLYSERLLVTGKYDQVLDGILVDFKTSASASPHTWMLQGTFYWMLAQENGIPLQRMCRFVQLLENGNFKEFVYDVTDENIKVCESAVETYRFLKKYGVLKD